jgi:DNA excision repair protein ERCC-6
MILTLNVRHPCRNNPKGDSESGSSNSSKKKASGGDDNVLSSLFEMTGIQSALQHDRIMESAAQDTFFVEREGKKLENKRGHKPTLMNPL